MKSSANMFRFFIKVFGCPTRAIDAEKVHRYFMANHGTPDHLTEADVVGIFTCSVTKKMNESVLNYIQQLKNSKQRIIVLGCLPAINQDELKKIFSGEILQLKALDHIDELFPEFNVKYSSISLPTECHPGLEYSTAYLNQFKPSDIIELSLPEKKPQIIRVCVGCRNHCSYCTIRNAIGSLKSLSVSEIGALYERYLQKGYSSFIFLGDDTGAYGIDIQTNFGELLTYLESITPPEKKIRWIIDNLNPQWLIRYNAVFMRFVEKGLIDDITVPIQAATDRLLHQMKRNHTMEEVSGVFENLKKINPRLNIKTHFIIGFPGELGADITAIKQFVDKNYCNHIVLLRYFESANTPSAAILPKIDREVTQKNMHELKHHIQKQGIFCQMNDYE